MPRGHNLLRVGDFNEAVVLDLIRRAPGGISRVQIAETTGLSAQTISNVCRRLLTVGVVREGERRVTGPGKPRILLQIDPASRYAVGVHLDPAVVTYVLLDMNGAVRSRHQTITPSTGDAQSVIASMARVIADLLAREDVPRDRLLGVGVAAPGPLDLTGGILIDPPLLDGWNDVPIREALAASTGFPVLLEKDVTAAAVAELWIDDSPARENFALFYYGTGIGVGIVAGNDVLRGASRNAGEIGHMMVQADGPLCRCGRRGCVSTFVTPGRLVSAAVDAGVLPARGSAQWQGDDSTDRMFDALARAAEGGDATAGEVLTSAAVGLARCLVTVVNILDIDHVVFGGPFWGRIESFMLDSVRERLADDPALVPTHEIVLETSNIGADVAAIGAGCLVLDGALSPRPSMLLISE